MDMTSPILTKSDLLRVLTNRSRQILELGIRRIGDAEPVTLGLLVYDYLRHLQHHLHRLEETANDTKE